MVNDFNTKNEKYQERAIQKVKETATGKKIMHANGFIADYRRVTEDPDSEFRRTKLKSRILVNQMLQNYELDYIKKFPFERSQFHQCIPNPVNTSELITV